jgi:catechol 2,3-dioxygenase-like lactoylglutathione lyase family enzyme
MPRALDIAYVVYQVTDLDRMEAFLRDFGLASAARTDDALYMRGTGPAPYIHVTRRGPDNRFVGGAFQMAAAADLEALARLPGSSPIEATGAPGGGERVRMRMPDGLVIEAVHGMASAAPLEMRAPNPFNAAQDKRRVNASLRPKREPCPVLRLGHFVLQVSDHDASVRWLRERLGLVPSDHFAVPGAPDRIVGTFLRVDRGEAFVDHHALLVLQSDRVGVHHCSFEVQDLDAIMSAHDFLLERGYRLDCGVGRHLLGSQIFDYWRDPFGFRVEHYTDGDVVNRQHRPEVFAGSADQTTQWGARPPAEFFE